MLKVILGTEALADLVKEGRQSAVFLFLEAIPHPLERAYVCAESVGSVQQACQTAAPGTAPEMGDWGPVALQNLDQLCRRARQYRRLIPITAETAGLALSLRARWKAPEIWLGDWFVYAIAHCGDLGGNVRLLMRPNHVTKALGLDARYPLAKPSGE